MKIRSANKTDVKSLVALENESFDTDRLSASRFGYFLKIAHCKLLVIEDDEKITGYGLILLHKGTALARLYSIAISYKYRGKGLAKMLVLKLEEMAKEDGATYLRLEVSVDNLTAINLYKSLGYREFNKKTTYYEDGSDALCFEKKIRNKSSKKVKGPKVTYYRQTTDFTCGPASLLMAMNALSKRIKLTRENEIQLWREATTIFMTSGHGGCGPHGLALAAHNRGFEVELYINTNAHLFVEGVRSTHKKEIIELVQNLFEKQLASAKVKIYNDEYDWDTINEIFVNGGIPVLLISAYRLTETKAPHWIVLTGIENDFIYFHDPEVDEHQTDIDNINIPVRRDEFEMMSKFGSRQLKSIVAIYPK